jgi:hypothetical protein
MLSRLPALQYEKGKTLTIMCCRMQKYKYDITARYKSLVNIANYREKFKVLRTCKLYKSRKTRRKWKYNIKANFKEIEWEVVDRIDLVHDMDQWRAFLHMIMNFQFL